MSVILAAFSSRPSSSSTSSTSRSRGRPYTSMDSIYSIVAGLGLRLVVGYASHHEFKIVGPLIGLWEGVVTLHFMKKAPSSFDPFVAYGVRMFIDYLVTENVSRMVLVVIWTVLGMALADVAPSIWFDVGLHRPWRRVRRDLYTLYSMTPKVPSFPKARAVRFSRSRNTVIDTPITFPEIDIEERRTLISDTTPPASDIVPRTESTSATRRRVSGSRFTTSVAPNSDAESVATSARRRPTPSSALSNPIPTVRTRRATVYAEPPSDTDDTGTVISDDLDVDNRSSGRSSTSPPSSQGTPHHEDWDLESSIESAPEIDVEEEIAAAQEEAEQQQQQQAELAQAKKDHGEEGESTPRARPMIFPPTPSDSAARWDLSYNDHAVPPPSAFLQQIPDDVQDYDHVPVMRGVLPPVVTLNMVKEEESDRPPPTPAKDDIPLRFRKGGASASAISTNRQYTPMSSRNSLGLETPAETPVDGNGAASTGASRVGGLSDEWASAPQPSSSTGSPSTYASVPTRLDRGPSIAIPQGPVADLMGLDTPSSAAEEDDMYLDEEESRSRVEQYMRNVAESQKDDDDEAEYQALLEFREKERRQEEEMVRLEEERRRRDEMERLRLQDAERLRLAEERRARLEEKRRVQEEERRVQEEAMMERLRQEEQAQAEQQARLEKFLREEEEARAQEQARLERLRQEEEARAQEVARLEKLRREEEEAEAQRLAQEARLAKRLRFAQEAEERARLAEEEAKARLAEQVRLAEEAERIRLAAEELERVRLAEEAERIRLIEQEAELRRLQEEREAERIRLEEQEAERSRIEQEQEAELRRLQEERSRIEQEEEVERRRIEKEEKQQRLAEEDAEKKRAAAEEKEQLKLKKEEKKRKKKEREEKKRKAEEDAAAAEAEAEAERERVEAARVEAERLEKERLERELREAAEEKRLADEAEEKRLADEAEEKRLADEAEQRRIEEALALAEKLREEEEEEQRRAVEVALEVERKEEEEEQRRAVEVALEAERKEEEDRRLAEEASQAEALRQQLEEDAETQRLAEEAAAEQQRLADEEAARVKKEQDEEDERLREQQAAAEAARAKEQEEEEERLRQQQATAEADLAAATAAEEAKRAELERLEEEQAAATRAAEELAAAQAQVDAEAPPVPEKEPASAEPGTPTQVVVQLATPTAPATGLEGEQEGEGEENVDDDALLGGGSDIGSVATAYTEVSLDVKSRLEKTISRRAQKIELEDRVAVLQADPQTDPVTIQSAEKVLRKYQKKIQRLYDDSTRLSMFWETPANNFMLKIATIPEVEERVRDALLFHLTPDCKSFNFTITIPSGKGPAVTRIKNAVVALLRDQLNIEPAAKDPNNGKILTLEMDEKDFPLWILDFRQRSTRGD
ncbi:hypothetical protein D9611_013246 [Ephemerocybe angulata]|uniref:Uncharacterized protein n=1 Tax=Ephemerocybe angulata TaxID=980116 RepID=A0A8H5CB06_9AGAR|nr:hypothetical protein D9611_013246 [Tulosesus angulatus]